MNKTTYLLGALLLLVGCGDAVIEPMATTVKKNQPNYTRPESGLISFRTIPEGTSTPCALERKEVYGCNVRTSDTTWQLYVFSSNDLGKSGLQAIMAHEFDHVTYGPEHN